MTSAYRRAGLLRYAAIQFVVLVAGAMAAYPGGTWTDRDASGYTLARNFLSDLGATRAWSGEVNYLSAVLFALALATLGGALAAFAWTWRAWAFARGRAGRAGVASAVLGTASGAAFAAIGIVPVDRLLALHNGIVVAAFALLLGFAATIAYVAWRNGVAGAAANVAYLAIVATFFAVASFGPRPDSPHGLEVQVVAQKLVVAASLVQIVALTTRVRRARAPA
jgi:hypothetical membrane protein